MWIRKERKESGTVRESEGAATKMEEKTKEREENSGVQLGTRSSAERGPTVGRRSIGVFTSIVSVFS